MAYSRSGLFAGGGGLFAGDGGLFAGGGGLFAGGGGLFAGGPFAAGLIAGGLFASGLNAATPNTHRLRLVGNYVVSDSKPFLISPGAVQKSDGSIRLIHDCSRPKGNTLNDYASLGESQRFQTIDDACSVLLFVIVEGGGFIIIYHSIIGIYDLLV